MREILNDNNFNTTLRIFVGCVFLSFVVYNLTACEIHRMDRAFSLKELKNTGKP